MRRIGRLPDVHLLAELRGLARHVEALARSIVDPAVVAAADAALLDLTPFQRRSPVRAMRIERADATLLVAEQHDLLAEELFFPRQVLQLFGEAGGLPIPAQEFAHRATRLDGRQLVIGRRNLASISRFHRMPLSTSCSSGNAKCKRHAHAAVNGGW